MCLARDRPGSRVAGSAACKRPPPELPETELVPETEFAADVFAHGMAIACACFGWVRLSPTPCACGLCGRVTRVRKCGRTEPACTSARRPRQIDPRHRFRRADSSLRRAARSGVSCSLRGNATSFPHDPRVRVAHV